MSNLFDGFVTQIVSMIISFLIGGVGGYFVRNLQLKKQKSGDGSILTQGDNNRINQADTINQSHIENNYGESSDMLIVQNMPYLAVERKEDIKIRKGGDYTLFIFPFKNYGDGNAFQIRVKQFSDNNMWGDRSESLIFTDTTSDMNYYLDCYSEKPVTKPGDAYSITVSVAIPEDKSRAYTPSSRRRKYFYMTLTYLDMFDNKYKQSVKTEYTILSNGNIRIENINCPKPER